MAGDGRQDNCEDSELEPAIVKVGTKKDQVSEVIGEVGRWQLEKILIVFLAAAPGIFKVILPRWENCHLFTLSGLSHIFHAGFITPKQKFWCAKAVGLDSEGLPPPWTIEYNDTATVEVWPGNFSYDKRVMGYCVPECVDYEFDDSFWVSTMVTEWDLVCEKSWLKTLAKML